MNITTFAIAGALLASIAAPTLAVTGTPGATTDESNIFSGDGPWTLGWTFTVNTSITVVALGAWDSNGDGFADSHAVGLWEDGGALLASTPVSSGDTLIANFRYAAIGPVTLAAGRTYVVGASDLGLGDDYVLDSAGSVIPQITYGQPRFFSGAGLSRPDFAGGRSFSYFGGNFLVDGGVIPEPGTWMMMIAGFGMIGFAARRRTALAA